MCGYEISEVVQFLGLFLLLLVGLALLWAVFEKLLGKWHFPVWGMMSVGLLMASGMWPWEAVQHFVWWSMSDARRRATRKRNERQRRWRQSGRCYDCGRTVVSGKQFCPTHHAARNAASSGATNGANTLGAESALGSVWTAAGAVASGPSASHVWRGGQCVTHCRQKGS